MKYLTNLLLALAILSSVALTFYFLFYHIDKIWYVLSYGYLALYVVAVYCYSAFIMSWVRSSKIISQMQADPSQMDRKKYDAARSNDSASEEIVVGVTFFLVFLTCLAGLICYWLFV